MRRRHWPRVCVGEEGDGTRAAAVYRVRLCKAAGAVQASWWFPAVFPQGQQRRCVCVCICMSVCLSLYSVCSSLSRPLSTSLDLSRPLSTSLDLCTCTCGIITCSLVLVQVARSFDGSVTPLALFAQSRRKSRPHATPRPLLPFSLAMC